MPGMNSNKAYRPKRPSNPGLQARKDWIKERLTATGGMKSHPRPHFQNMAKGDAFHRRPKFGSGPNDRGRLPKPITGKAQHPAQGGKPNLANMTDSQRRAKWANILGYNPNIKPGHKPGDPVTKMGFQMPTWKQIKSHKGYEAGRFHPKGGSDRADNRQMKKQRDEVAKPGMGSNRDRIKNGIVKSQPNRAFDVVSVKVGPNIGPDGLTPRQKKLRKMMDRRANQVYKRNESYKKESAAARIGTGY